MHLENLREYCLAKAEVTEGLPFGPNALVFKVAGKMFALATMEADPHFRVNLKCDPERAAEMREQHEAILPGYHMNKQHWNTVVLDGTLPDSFVKELVDHSYDLVVASLPKKTRVALGWA